MFRALPFALVALSAVALPAAPAAAQTTQEQRRYDAAQRRYDNETTIYNRERQYYQDAQRRDRRRSGYNDQRNTDPRYNDPRYNDPNYETRYATTYDAARDYRDDSRYQERTLSSNDQVYRGSDGRYYCKRNDGTTGLIIGGLAGGVAGNVIDGGNNRVAGTLIGGALGAILGKTVDQNSGNNQQVRCR
ncbi:MAG: glycine zipper 2TM domain-containing protein [Pseudomonadota bacterium]